MRVQRNAPRNPVITLATTTTCVTTATPAREGGSDFETVLPRSARTPPSLPNSTSPTPIRIFVSQSETCSRLLLGLYRGNPATSAPPLAPPFATTATALSLGSP